MVTLRLEQRDVHLDGDVSRLLVRVTEITPSVEEIRRNYVVDLVV